MSKKQLSVALVLVAGLCLVGFTRLRHPGAPPEEARPLLITSTIGATSAFLFVVDPLTRNLAAYEATPGDGGGLRLLGARKIEHDLELARYRDRSEYSFEQLGRLKGQATGEPAETNAPEARDGS